MPKLNLEAFYNDETVGTYDDYIRQQNDEELMSELMAQRAADVRKALEAVEDAMHALESLPRYSDQVPFDALRHAYKVQEALETLRGELQAYL